MIPKVSRSGLEEVSGGFPTSAFGAESEFRDFVDKSCCCYGVCGEGGRIPSGGQMQFVIPKTFANQLQIHTWHKCDSSFDWLH